MKSFFLGCISILCLFNATHLISQTEVKADSTFSNYWLFGLGFNAVDDSGDGFNNLTAISEQWHVLPYPSRASIGRYFKSGIGIELIGSINRYQEGKLVDGVLLTEEVPYWSVDSRFSYNLDKITGQLGVFDPYLGLGFGYTQANNLGRETLNGGIGIRLWFSKQWGLDLNSTAKWSLNNEASNHLQHAIGLVYRKVAKEREVMEKIKPGSAFPGTSDNNSQHAVDEENTKDVDEESANTEDPETAVAMVDQVTDLIPEDEDGKMQDEANDTDSDSIYGDTAEENILEDKNKLFRDALAALGAVNYELNSSYLTQNAKNILKELAGLMHNDPTVRIEILGHADSRGTDTYNVWLSKRRAKRAADFLISLGIAPSRILTNGYGESQLLNNCTDNVVCSEAEHAINRRVAIRAVE